MEIVKIKEYFKNKRILITGHDGFKGAWLSAWLNLWGAKLYGISIKDNDNIDHFQKLNISIVENKVDLKNFNKISKFINDIKPEIIFHLAAQPIVLRSYSEPIKTIESNVLGTSNILEICRHIDSLKSLLIITSDKVYKNFNDKREYTENDELGGKDIYSASKACAEILSNAYYNSFYQYLKNVSLVTARAGNVIGGGDWSEYRIIPDIFRAVIKNSKFIVRNPKSTRPWQHVLDCIFGYMLLAYNIDDKAIKFNSYNFGPKNNEKCNVEELIKKIKKKVLNLNYKIDKNTNHIEENYLSLSSINVKKELNWSPLLNLDESIDKTVEWYNNYITNGKIITLDQINYYEKQLMNLKK